MFLLAFKSVISQMPQTDIKAALEKANQSRDKNKDETKGVIEQLKVLRSKITAASREKESCSPIRRSTGSRTITIMKRNGTSPHDTSADLAMWELNMYPTYNVSSTIRYTRAFSSISLRARKTLE